MTILYTSSKLFQRFERLITALVVSFVAFASASTVHAQQLEKIRIGASSTSLVMLPMLLADVNPLIFAKHGLQLEFQPLPGGNNCFAAVFSGASDVCMHGTTSGTDAVANGADFQVIAVTTGPITEIILSQKTATRLGVTAQDPIDKKLRALKGLRVSAIGFHEVTLDAMFKSVGMSVANDISVLKLSDPLTMMQSIRNDQIDAAMWTIGSLGGVLADKSGIRFISIPRRDIAGLENLPTVSAFVQTPWYNSHKPQAVKIQAAISDAIAQLKSDPVGSSKVVKAKYGAATAQDQWDDGYKQALLVLFDGAKAKRAPWDRLIQMQTASTKQNYSNAAFDKLVAPQARAD